MADLKEARKAADRANDRCDVGGKVRWIPNQGRDEADSPADGPAKAHIACPDLQGRFRAIAKFSDVGIELLAKPPGDESGNDRARAAEGSRRQARRRRRDSVLGEGGWKIDGRQSPKVLTNLGLIRKNFLVTRRRKELRPARQNFHARHKLSANSCWRSFQLARDL